MYIRYNDRSGGILGNVGCLLMGIVGLILAYYVVKGVFTLLWWLAPVLFVATLILDWHVVSDAGKAYLKLVRNNPISGLFMGVLALIALPVTVLLLFLTALGKRKIGQGGIPWMQPKRTTDASVPKDEYIDFEEIATRPLRKMPVEEPLPEIPKTPKTDTPPRTASNPYDDLFR